MPRPRAVTRSDDALLTNFELARVFREIGDMLEIMGEVVYKAVAYRRVADAIERYPEDVASLYRRGTPPKLPGAGPALSRSWPSCRKRAAWPITTSCTRRCPTACWRS